jgi:hypothetical protein
MPRCSHRKKARPSRKTQSDTRKAGCTRFKSNQVPLIPASRGIITRRLTPASFLVPFPPPFFFSTSCSQVRPTTNNSTALRLFPPFALCTTLFRSSHRALTFTPSRNALYLSRFTCALEPRARDRIECLSHAISASKLEAGQGGFG